jgi:hypothetical protein
LQTSVSPEVIADDALAAPLPAYDDAWLASQTPAELIELMRRDEDRVPRNVIDECVRRGGVLLNAFEQLLRDEERYWSDSTQDGDWWLHTHAIHTLGLMTSERSGEMLLAYLRQIDDNADDSLHEWHNGHWPALFANKPGCVDASLLEYVRNPMQSPYSRLDALEAALGRAMQQGEAALDQVLNAIARLCEDKREARESRLLFGSVLLDFPRQRHRAMLQKMARSQQQDDFPQFDFQAVTAAFMSPPQKAGWQHMAPPWKFYEPAEIAARQQRWKEQDQEVQETQSAEQRMVSGAGDLPALSDSQQQYFGYDGQPLSRTAPKVGRNDPCPCGSGKKYKKCCLDKAA